ncbi:MAG: hypothetical protein AAFQ89_13575 [Cyanobacteria bacterium J06626_18]
MCAAWPGFLYLVTGLHTVNVGFTLDVLDTPPPIDDVWEEIVEVSFNAGIGKITLFDWCGGEAICDIPLSPGTDRVRYCARGMGEGWELDTNIKEPVDFYYLAFWPAPQAPDAVLKTLD